MGALGNPTRNRITTPIRGKIGIPSQSVVGSIAILSFTINHINVNICTYNIALSIAMDLTEPIISRYWHQAVLKIWENLKKDLKYLNKKKKMLYRMAKKTGSRKELSKVKTIITKKRFNSSSRSSYSSSGSDSSLPPDSEWEIEEPIIMETNRLDHVVSSNVKYYNKLNDVVANELKFDINPSLADIPVKEPQPLVTIILIGGKKSRNTLLYGLTCLWHSRDSGSIIKRKNIKKYKSKLISNKAKYSTASGPYCITHYAKVPYIITEFSSRKIISHRLYADNKEENSGIVYYIIIGHDLMVQLGLMADFKHKVLAWDDTVVPVKVPEKLIGGTMGVEKFVSFTRSENQTQNLDIKLISQEPYY